MGVREHVLVAISQLIARAIGNNQCPVIHDLNKSRRIALG